MIIIDAFLFLWSRSEEHTSELKSEVCSSDLDHKNKKASIIIITHKTNESDANKCLKSFKFNRNILKVPTRIRLF